MHMKTYTHAWPHRGPDHACVEVSLNAEVVTTHTPRETTQKEREGGKGGGKESERERDTHTQISLSLSGRKWKKRREEYNDWVCREEVACRRYGKMAGENVRQGGGVGWRGIEQCVCAR